MTASSIPFARSTTRANTQPAVRLLFAAGALVALLDGLYVVVVFDWIRHSTTAARIFAGIARALIGQAASSGGAAVVLLGVSIHCMVALGWSTVFAVAYSRIGALRRLTSSAWRAAAVGVVYGIFVWAAMRYLVLPLTHAVRAPLLTRGTGLVLLAHLLVVGPPIALVIRRSGMGERWARDDEGRGVNRGNSQLTHNPQLETHSSERSSTAL